jgi:predicted RNA-binding Zn-ribbon protein involved in translation (DUF1610 family)
MMESTQISHVPCGNCGTEVLAFHDAELYESTREQFRSQLPEGASIKHEVTFRKKDGSEIKGPMALVERGGFVCPECGGQNIVRSMRPSSEEPELN